MQTTLDRITTPAPAPPAPPRRDWPTLLLLAGASGLFLALAGHVLVVWMAAYAQPESDYAYGPIVPALVGLMLWHRRGALQEAGVRPCLGALAALLPSLGLLILAEKKEFEAVSSFGLLMTVWSGLWLLCGTRWVRAAAFPLAFLAWMAPLPGPVIHDATYGCQQLCTLSANRALHLLGFQTTLSGNVITLNTFVLFVDVPCSGMKLLLTLLMFGAAFAWLCDGPPRRRLALFAVTAPLTFAVNTLRITLLGVLGECFGAHTEHVFHDSSGLLMVAVGLAALFGIARRIGCRTFAGWPLF